MNGMGTKPDQEFKVGSVKASVWSNPRETRDGKLFNSHKVIVDRIYRDAQGEFKATSSLDVNDIPKAILALKKAYDYLMTRQGEAVEFKQSGTAFSRGTEAGANAQQQLP